MRLVKQYTAEEAVNIAPVPQLILPPVQATRSAAAAGGGGQVQVRPRHAGAAGAGASH